MDTRTLEILAQVVYKAMMDKNDTLILSETQWKLHLEQTLELARNIIRLNKQVNLK